MNVSCNGIWLGGFGSCTFAHLLVNAISKRGFKYAMVNSWGINCENGKWKLSGRMEPVKARLVGRKPRITGPLARTTTAVNTPGDRRRGQG